MTGIDWTNSFEEISDQPKPSAGADGYDRDADWPVPADTAFYGLAGDVVTSILPNTESDPAALLLQYLVSFGNAVGRQPFYLVEGTRHFTNLYTVLAGKTAKSRKGTSAGRIRAVYEIVDPDWARERVGGGMSSGEGLIYVVRDPVFGIRRGVEEMIDAGVFDKRFLLDEREFSQALTVLKREGNTLSRVFRDAWDGLEYIGSLTKHSPTHVTRPHISLVGHITIDELRKQLDQTSMANGYANRILFACVRRSKLLPHGGTQDEEFTRLLGTRTREALAFARGVERVIMTADGRQYWVNIYAALAEGAPGLLGAITARAEAQTTRLALIYALLDRSPQIDIVHLEAGLAVWRFCEASARYIFGDTVGDPAADTILRALKSAGANGLSRTDIYKLFGCHLAASKIDASLVLLLNTCKARPANIKGATGAKRPVEVWFAV